MKIYAVTEGVRDRVLLGMILDKLFPSLELGFFVAGGALRLSTVARTLRIQTQRPVLVVGDGDSLDVADVARKEHELRSEIEWSTGSAPCLVALIPPEFDPALLLERDSLARLVGRELTDEEAMMARLAPHQFWQRVGLSWGEAFDRLTDREIEEISRHTLVQPIVRFVQSMVEADQPGA